MALSTWETREQRALEAIFEAEEADQDAFSTVDLAESLGIDISKARRSARALYEAGYIYGSDASTTAGFDLLGMRLLERGRRAVGQWPSEDVYDALVRLLQAQIAEEEDPERRTRLQRLLTSVTEVGKDVAGGVLVSLARQVLGLP